MSLDDWLLALHLLSAFFFVGAITMFSVAIVATRWIETPRQALAVAAAVRPANVAIGVGVLGTIVFGVWLALSIDAYHIWDLWVILAIVGWAVATELGRRGGALMGAAFARAEALVAEGAGATPDADLTAALRSPLAARLHWASTAIMLLVLADMIWKPGA